MNNWNDIVVQASGRFHEDSEFGGFGSFLKKAIHGITSVPVLGGALHAVYDVSVAGPLSLATNIAKGQRIDRAALGSLKTQLNGVKEVAPYVQTVVTLVPGVGQGVGAAIGAASALAAGKNITDAMLSAAKGAIPGGPVAQAAFSIAQAGVQGKPIDQIALAALPISDEQKKMVVASVQAAKDIAHGKNVAKSVYESGKAVLPQEAQLALQTGIAIGHGRNLQELAKQGASMALPKLAAIGNTKALTDPALKAGLNIMHTAEEKSGFRAGVGLMQHHFIPAELNAIRGNLTPDQKKGFDVALAAHVGKLKSPLVHSNPAHQFGWYVAHGMAGAKDKNQAAMKQVLARSGDMLQASIAQRTAPPNFLTRVKLTIRGLVT